MIGDPGKHWWLQFHKNASTKDQESLIADERKSTTFHPTQDEYLTEVGRKNTILKSALQNPEVLTESHSLSGHSKRSPEDTSSTNYVVSRSFR